MGGGTSSNQAAIAEFITQKGKPVDASDVAGLQAAREEIRKLRSLTQELDIHDFDDYLRTKKHSQSISKSQSHPFDVKSSPELNSPKGAIVSSEDHIPQTIPATDALQKKNDINQIAQAVKVKLDHRLVSLDEAFRKLDVQHTGFISRQEFLDACWYWGVQLQESDFAAITNKAVEGGTGHNDGCIDYLAFIELMSRITHAEYPVEAFSNEIAHSHARSNHQEIDEVLRSRVLDSGLTMKQCFKEFDKDGSGCIEREEMRQVLRSLNVTFTEDQLDVLYFNFDFNGDGKFQYSEFVRLIQNT